MYKGNITSWTQWLWLYGQGYTVVDGNFNCRGVCKEIKVDMAKMPRVIKGNCDIVANNLTSLEGSLEKVEGWLNFSGNKIKRLDFLPIVGESVIGISCEIEEVNASSFQSVFDDDVDLSENKIGKIIGLNNKIFNGEFLLNKNNRIGKMDNVKRVGHFAELLVENEELFVENIICVRWDPQSKCYYCGFFINNDGEQEIAKVTEEEYATLVKLREARRLAWENKGKYGRGKNENV